ncbi:MAG: hypothetical protein M2R45_01584 [Verrucomicrobia subdivision 3 bacterium]|nr:hypothetical protein [Limisphaerales bacterium]MCS1412737.1 hypothetical protein [Limisphaerales bacterium]
MIIWNCWRAVIPLAKSTDNLTDVAARSSHSPFRDTKNREAFNVRRENELITCRRANGNKVRSKFSPNVNVQAMMSYEMMRAGPIVRLFHRIPRRDGVFGGTQYRCLCAEISDEALLGVAWRAGTL